VLGSNVWRRMIGVDQATVIEAVEEDGDDVVVHVRPRRDSSGWQPPYTVEEKILGAYIKANFAGKKIGYLYQGDEFGQDFVKGLDLEIPSASVVSRQTYDAATLAGPLSNQIAALKAAGAQVIAMATIPAATALAMLPGAAIGYFPQYVISNVGADSPTVGPLLSSFTQKGGGSAAEAQAPVC
jgi:branched-chain amino acid transport system substrate-binding protein